ncbi:hypothetical protein ACHQM5_022687 [Ranunculus cassubicifolius]
MGGDRAAWIPELHQQFIYLCIDLVQKGHRPGSHLNKTGYKLLCEEFFKRTGKDYGKTQMKNHWDQTKEQWKYWVNLRDNITGAGYDHELKTFTAGKDFWDDWFKNHPKCQDFRSTPLKFQDECDYLFGGTTATGEFQFAPSSGSLRDFTEGPVRADDPNNFTPDVVQETQQQSSEDDDPVEENADDRGKKKYSTVKKRRRLSGASRLNNSLEKIVGVIEARNKNASSSQSVKEYTITECIKALDETPNIPLGSDLYFLATKCFQDKNLRETFMALPIELRAKWLEKQE